MKKVALTAEEKRELLQAIEELRQEAADIYTEVEVGNILIYVSGYVEIEGYIDDAYFGGTGEKVITSREVSRLEIHAYDENGDEVKLDTEIEKEACKILEAA